MITRKYTRAQLPQWTIEDVIKHDYTYYFGLEHCRRLKPTQFVDDYEEERVDKKRRMLEVGQFDPIIVDYDFNIICGHHRHKVLFEHDPRLLFPIICLEGVAVEDVVKYYSGIKAHEEAMMDRAIEDYDFNKLYQEQQRYE